MADQTLQEWARSLAKEAFTQGFEVAWEQGVRASERYGQCARTPTRRYITGEEYPASPINGNEMDGAPDLSLEIQQLKDELEQVKAELQPLRAERDEWLTKKKRCLSHLRGASRAYVGGEGVEDIQYYVRLAREDLLQPGDEQ